MDDLEKLQAELHINNMFYTPVTQDDMDQWLGRYTGQPHVLTAFMVGWNAATLRTKNMIDRMASVKLAEYAASPGPKDTGERIAAEPPKVKTVWVGKARITTDNALAEHDQSLVGQWEWQFSDGPVGERGSSSDYLDLAEGLRDHSGAIIIWEDN